jgi:hypothetical protein
VKHAFTLSVAAGILLLAGSGCFYSVLQTPEVLPPGEMSLGPILGTGAGYYVGSEYFTDGVRPAELELGVMLRKGIVKNLESGLRFSVPLGGMVDVKYQLLRGRFLLAADLGFSQSLPADLGSLSRDRRTYSVLYPMLLAGTGRYYGGIKTACIYERHTDAHRSATRIQPGVFFGAACGRRWKVLPEVNTFLNPIMVGAAVGLQYTF